MKTNETLKIAIAEPSVLIRTGIVGTLKRAIKNRIQTFEISSQNAISQTLTLNKPDVLIINPTYWGMLDVAKFKEESNLSHLKVVAITYAPFDDSLLKQYDDSISIFDTTEQISAKIEHLFEAINTSTNSIGAEVLSLREKEIITCVVKGMTNKEIADKLFLSTHTVITHRRNIARKLEVHSTAGLTVYAIVNKLISLDDINK